MKINAVLNNGPNALLSAERVLALTAIFYLKDALINERYEECAELIIVAREFGVSPADIKKVIGQGISDLRTAWDARKIRPRASGRRF